MNEVKVTVTLEDSTTHEVSTVFLKVPRHNAIDEIFDRLGQYETIQVSDFSRIVFDIRDNS